MPLTPTDTQNFIECLDAGTLEPRLAHIISDVATATREFGDKKRKGKIVLTLEVVPYGNGAEIDVKGNLEFKRPTSRGSMGENLGFNSRFYVNEKGNVTDYPDKQIDAFNKPHQSSKPKAVTSINNQQASQSEESKS